MYYSFFPLVYSLFATSSMFVRCLSHLLHLLLLLLFLPLLLLLPPLLLLLLLVLVREISWKPVTDSSMFSFSRPEHDDARLLSSRTGSRVRSAGNAFAPSSLVADRTRLTPVFLWTRSGSGSSRQAPLYTDQEAQSSRYRTRP